VQLFGRARLRRLLPQLPARLDHGVRDHVVRQPGESEPRHHHGDLGAWTTVHRTRRLVALSIEALELSLRGYGTHHNVRNSHCAVANYQPSRGFGHRQRV
jgi:hypothetical protein